MCPLRPQCDFCASLLRFFNTLETARPVELAILWRDRADFVRLPKLDRVAKLSLQILPDNFIPSLANMTNLTELSIQESFTSMWDPVCCGGALHSGRSLVPMRGEPLTAPTGLQRTMEQLLANLPATVRKLHLLPLPFTTEDVALLAATCESRVQLLTDLSLAVFEADAVQHLCIPSLRNLCLHLVKYPNSQRSSISLSKLGRLQQLQTLSLEHFLFAKEQVTLTSVTSVAGLSRDLLLSGNLSLPALTSLNLPLFSKPVDLERISCLYPNLQRLSVIKCFETPAADWVAALSPLRNLTAFSARVDNAADCEALAQLRILAEIRVSTSVNPALARGVCQLLANGPNVRVAALDLHCSDESQTLAQIASHVRGRSPDSLQLGDWLPISRRLLFRAFGRLRFTLRHENCETSTLELTGFECPSYAKITFQDEWTGNFSWSRTDNDELDSDSEDDRKTSTS